MKTFIRTSLGLGLLALILAACNISPTPGERPQIRAMEDHLEVDAEIAWIPNSSEGTVSKVDVQSGLALARYQTVDPNGAEPGDDELFAQRTSRVAVDGDGNAYVLNVASHGDDPMQGSLARVMAEGEAGEDASETSQNHDDVLDFGDDVRVTHWNIGDVGDMPRTVAVVGDSLWVGFYGSSEVKEYELAVLAGDSGVDNPEPTSVQTVAVSPLTPYSHAGALDSEGNMYFISRDAFPAGEAGLGVVDTDSGEFKEIDIGGGTGNPYSLLVDGDDHVWFSDAGNWGQNITRYLGQYDPVADEVIHHDLDAHIQMRGMTLDGDGNIWITRDDDKVVRATIDHDTKTVTAVDTFDVTPSGQPTVGIAGDSAGNLWVIQRNDGPNEGFLVKLDSEGNVVTESDPVTITVGLAPYAYGAFVVFVEFGAIDGYKAITAELAAHLADLEVDDPLAGWEIKLHEDDDGDVGDQITTTSTDADGHFLFEDVEAGTYFVCENVLEGTFQLDPDPADNGCHEVEVTAGETTRVEVDEPMSPVVGEADYAFLNDVVLVFEGETAWAANEDEPGELPYNEDGRGNWATYVEYEGSEDTGKTTTLFAGQTIEVGSVDFSAAVAGEVTITVELSGDWEFADVSENLKVQNYEEAPEGNPSPGQFDHKETCDPDESTCTIVVPEDNFYGVHVEVGQWVPHPELGS